MSILLLIALGVVIYLWQSSRNKVQPLLHTIYTLEAKNQALLNCQETLQVEQAKNADFQQEIYLLEEQNRSLSKYQGIGEAEQQAAKILENAKTEANRILSEANSEANRIGLLAKESKQEAAREAQSIKQKAESILTDATVNAKRIVEEAEKRAESIAGDAYKAMQNVDNLEKSAKAIKNIIEGYGNQYLIPSYTLLDELAEEFGHVEAGERLKQIREQIRVMVKNRVAGKCDYVETNRKETAIDFVVDAFNGKVDSILSTVKRDNYGALEQKIKDAFQVVNLKGQPFRNAAIVSEYLAVRLEELKWAVTLNELKFKEKEEQRIIKERIREEEKARREYEKAIKEAEKEEDTLKKAIEKAQKEAEKASAAQKAEYEDRLQGLLAKLKEAEEKNQRAVSMAQQTKAGNVYIISNIGSFGENVYKIGMTRRLEPLDRVKELGDASVPFPFDVHAMIYSDDAPKLENELHKKFIQMQVNKVNPRKEFFKLPLSDIKSEIEREGIQPKWTLLAEATEYRESLAIEQAILADETKKAEWLRYQMENVDGGEMEEDIH